MKRFISKGRLGFVCYELHIVIGIVFLLAALLFPVFARARENVRRSSCQSNLKQISLGFKQYVQDYNKKFPLANNINAVTGTGGWAVILQPYLKSTEVFRCPSGPKRRCGSSPIAPTNPGYTSYWMNGNVAGKKEAAFTATANTLLMGDTDTNTFGLADHSATYDGRIDGNSTKTTQHGSRITNWYTSLGPGAPAPQQYAASAKHLDGANYAFADGHVKWMKNNKPSNAIGKALMSGSFSFRVN